MRKFLTLTAAAALALAVGFAGTAKAEVVFPFDGDLVGYWPFDVNAADPTADASGNGNDANLGATNTYQEADDPTYDCTLANIAPTFGNVCGLDFDGSDDFGTVPNAQVLDVTSAYTISVWVRSDDTTASQHRPILVRGRNDGTNANDIEVYIQNSSKDLIVAVNRNNGGAFDFVGFVDPPLSTVFHLAVRYDGTDVNVFYDGVSQAVVQQTTVVNAPLDTDRDWLIGKVNHSAFGGERFFDGLIDEVRIYDVALTDLEVAALASAGAIVVNDDDADGSPPCRDPDFSIVQDGIDAVSDELKTVLVCPGTYVEDLVIFTDDVTLIGDDMSSSIIEGATVHGGGGPGFPFCDGPPIDLQANGVTIENLTINTPLTAANERTCGLIIDGVDNEIADNYFNVGIGANFSVAIQTWVAGSEVINDISGLHIHDNNFTNLPSLNGGRYIGVFINPQSGDEDADNDVLIEHNVLSGSMFFGIAVARGNTEVAHNQVDGAAAGVLLDVPGGEGDEANSVHNNSIGHSTFAGILITSDDNVVFRNSTHHTTGAGDGGGDGIQVSGDDNTFEGNNSHHNEDNAYQDDGNNNCFDNAGADRNKAKKNGNNDIPFGPGGAASCP